MKQISQYDVQTASCLSLEVLEYTPLIIAAPHLVTITCHSLGGSLVNHFHDRCVSSFCVTQPIYYFTCVVNRKRHSMINSQVVKREIANCQPF